MSGIDKGDRVRLKTGEIGEVFWTGESRYGEGMRFGVRADDGETHWIDEADVTKLEGDEAKPPEPQEPETEALAKGTTVTIVNGGAKAEVFWIGKSKFGKGWRYGVKDEAGDTHWLDENELVPDLAKDDPR